MGSLSKVVSRDDDGRRGASLDGRLFFGGTDGSNPVPSSGESSELCLGSGSRLPTQLPDHGGRAGDSVPTGNPASNSQAIGRETRLYRAEPHASRRRATPPASTSRRYGRPSGSGCARPRPGVPKGRPSASFSPGLMRSSPRRRPRSPGWRRRRAKCEPFAPRPWAGGSQSSAS